MIETSAGFIEARRHSAILGYNEPVYKVSLYFLLNTALSSSKLPGTADRHIPRKLPRYSVPVTHGRGVDFAGRVTISKQLPSVKKQCSYKPHKV